MTKRIQKKRQKRRYRFACIGVALHYQAANAAAKVANFVIPPLPESSVANAVRGVVNHLKVEHAVNCLVEAAKGLKLAAEVKALEDIRGKWAPVRRAA